MNKVHHRSANGSDPIAGDQRYRQLFNQMPFGIVEEDYASARWLIEQAREEGTDDVRGYLREHSDLVFEAASAITLRDANPAALRIFGASSLQDYVKTLQDFAVWPWAEFYIEQFAALAESGEFQMEIEEPKIDGTRIVARWTSLIADGSDTDWGSVISTVEDISDRKLIEQALVDSYRELEFRVEQRTSELHTANRMLREEIAERKTADKERHEAHALFRQAETLGQLGHWEWDEVTNRLISCSEEYSRILGMTVDEVMSTASTQAEDREMIHPDDRTVYDTVMAAAIGINSKFDLEYRMIRRDGAVRHVHEVTVNKTNEQGSPFRSFGILQDITERKEIEAALLNSEEKFASAFRSCPDAIMVTTLEDGRFVDVNDNVVRLTGYSREELIGHTVLEFGLWSDLNRRETLMKMLNEYGVVRGYEIDVTVQEGRHLALEISDEIANIDGKPCMVTVSRDITERKAGEEALRRYQHILDATSDAIVFVDPAYIIGAVNRAYLDWFGVTSKQALHHKVEDLIGEDFFHYFAKPNMDKALAGQSVKGVAWYRFPTTDLRCIEVYYNPYRDADGAIRGAVLSIRDTTERKQQEQALAESEEKFAKAFRFAPNTITISSMADGRFIDVNENVGRITGFSREELLGKTVFDVNYWVHEEDRQEVVRKLKSGEEVRDFEVQMRPRSGEIRTCEFSAERVEIGGEECMIGITKDVTSRKNAEEALRRYQHILDSSTDAAVFIDREYICRAANRAYLEWHGATEDEIIGNSHSRIVGEDFFAKSSKSNIDRALAGQSFTEMLWYDYRGVGRRCIEVHFNPYRDNEGTVSAAVLSLRDVTKRIETEQVLAESAKLAATGRMAARVAHEINNPLAGIKNSFLLIKGAIAEDYPYFEYVGRIERELNRVSDIVRQMLDLYRPTAQRETDVELLELLDDVVLLLEPLCRQNQVRVVREIPPSGIFRLTEGILRQALFNVLGNAIKFSLKGGQVEVRAESDADNVTVSVTDHGPGIQADKTDAIFEPFYSDAPAATPSLGLGLAVSRNLMQGIGGSIEFESIADKATTFHLRVPVTRRKAQS